VVAVEPVVKVPQPKVVMAVLQMVNQVLTQAGQEEEQLNLQVDPEAVMVPLEPLALVVLVTQMHVHTAPVVLQVVVEVVTTVVVLAHTLPAVAHPGITPLS
jgi:hypothetical protein